ncbi:hypothetical protein Hanom_Chr11g00982621 [Helianthus anomalus]
MGGQPQGFARFLEFPLCLIQGTDPISVLHIIIYKLQVLQCFFFINCSFDVLVD